MQRLKGWLRGAFLRERLQCARAGRVGYTDRLTSFVSKVKQIRKYLKFSDLGTTSEQSFRERMVRGVVHMSEPGYKQDYRLYIIYISAP